MFFRVYGLPQRSPGWGKLGKLGEAWGNQGKAKTINYFFTSRYFSVFSNILIIRVILMFFMVYGLPQPSPGWGKLGKLGEA